MKFFHRYLLNEVMLKKQQSWINKKHLVYKKTSTMRRNYVKKHESAIYQ